MRKEIIGLIVSAGLVYATAASAKDMNRDERGPDNKVTSSETAKRHSGAKQQKLASKNYYKHAKTSQGTTNRNTRSRVTDQQDEYVDQGFDPRARPTGFTGGYNANHQFLNRVEEDLPMNQIGRDHR